MHKRCFDVTLRNLIEEAVPNLRKSCHPFPPFLFTNTPLSNEGFYIFHLPLFLTTTLPATLLINHIFSWKGKPKHTGVDITRFFSNAKCYAKSSLTKHKNCLLEASYGTSQTSKLELFTKKVNDL